MHTPPPASDNIPISIVKLITLTFTHSARLLTGHSCNLKRTRRGTKMLLTPVFHLQKHHDASTHKNVMQVIHFYTKMLNIMPSVEKN